MGLQAVRYDCPNRKCPRRHWIIVYRLRLVPRLRLEVVEIVRSLGPEPEHLRASLRHVAAIDEDTLEFMVAAASLKPEMV